MPDWQAMFVSDVPWLELVLRGTVTYLILLLLVRFLGQREPAGLGPSDLLVVVLIGSATGVSLTGHGDSIGDGPIPVVTIVFWSVLTDALTYRWPQLTPFVKGRPKPLIENGELNMRVMRRELISRAELDEVLRTHGIEDVSSVQRAYLEPSGQISFVKSDR